MSRFHQLPSVDEVLRSLQHLELPHRLVVGEIRSVLGEQRAALIAGAQAVPDPVPVVQQRLHALLSPSLRPVINATGVILHTNLGRAPLSRFIPISGYSNLEYDLATGKRGKRDVHTAALLRKLIERPAIVLNNNASAVYLVLNELAAGHEVIVSRGELIEIGDGFRIPEIMIRSGAILREVGTTNRTRTEDYAQAITDRTRLIMRVHPSNFHISGFAARPELSDLCELGRARAIPIYEDLGSGCLVDLRSHGVSEPLVSDTFAAGTNLVSFSCDKLLGGPQSGIVAGDEPLVQRVRRNPMYRAFRADKLVIEMLQTTLRQLLLEKYDAIPTLRMIAADPASLEARAERLASQVPGARMRPGESPIGGGSTPDQALPTCVVVLDVEDPVRFERALRRQTPPVIARIERDQIVLDVRTVADQEEALLIEALRAALESG